jgi:hypothetical protein
MPDAGAPGHTFETARSHGAPINPSHNFQHLHVRNTAGALELRAIPIDIRALGEDATFTGYASRFGEQDSDGDVVMPGAFQASIQASGARGVKLLWQQRGTRLVARPLAKDPP